MAQLIGEVQGNRGKVHRLGSKLVHSRLASWTHQIYTWLDNEGNYKIEISKINSHTIAKIIEGNIANLSVEPKSDIEQYFENSICSNNK